MATGEEHLLALLGHLPRAEAYEGMPLAEADPIARADGLTPIVVRLPLADGIGFNLDLRPDRVWLVVADETVQSAHRG